MGYIKHDAIVVTSWNEDHLTQARVKAISIELPVTEIIESPVNGYHSFLIAPDGSKEGWAESDKGDAARAAWTTWATDTDLYLDWVHISYGGDEPENCEIVDYGGDDSNEDSDD